METNDNDTLERVGESSSNTAARDALRRIDMRLVSMNCDSTQKRIVDTCRMIVKRALSAPLRNCDVGTASQQAQRFAELCTSHSKDGARGICDEKCPFYGKEYGSDCALVWAQMPYERGIEE